LPVEPYNNGYFEIIADPAGAQLKLVAQADGRIICQAGPVHGRHRAWLFTHAPGHHGYWLVRTAAQIRTPPPVSIHLTNIDGGHDPVRVEQAHHDSENQHWSFAVDGQVLRVRCRKDSNLRLQAVAGAGAHLVLDALPVPVLADWDLRETKPDD
jgi:hypothetical protein